MHLRKFALISALFVCLGGVANAQSSSDPRVVLLTVAEGFPLQVILTEKLRFKENEVVHARLAESLYAFDREVVPSGAEVVGRITGFHKAGKWKRFFTMVGGDFTPLREPQVTFET